MCGSSEKGRFLTGVCYVAVRELSSVVTIPGCYACTEDKDSTQLGYWHRQKHWSPSTRDAQPAAAGGAAVGRSWRPVQRAPAGALPG